MLEKLRQAKRIGLVLGGGSMRCAFQVGVIECLRELLLEPSVCIGVSGGAWNAAAVAARTDQRLRYYWRSFARMPYISLFNLAREHSPFMFRTVHHRTFSRYVGSDRLKHANAIPCFVMLSRLRDRTPLLVDLREVDDPLEVLLATNYLPPYYTHAPRIQGERCGDGGMANNCPYEAAFEQGCDAVILVAVKGESEGGLYRNPGNTDHQIPPAYRDSVVVIRPRHRLPFSFTERRLPALEKLMDLGYLRAREVLLGERYDETEIRAEGEAPTLRIARLLRGLSRKPVPMDVAAE